MPAGTTPLARTYAAPALELRGRRFAWGERTYVMGILNVAPDSFSGDGITGDLDALVARAARFAAAGADLLDLGAESSRPGAAELSPAEELARLMPALEALRASTPLPLSIDTYHAAVATAALAAGADAVNDIHGLRRDPAMAAAIAARGASLFAMHNQRGRPHTDVASDIRAGFQTTLGLAHAAGLARDRVVLDPGFGFGWSPEQNLEMIRRLPELWEFELPLLVGTSRKSTLGLVLGTPVDDRLEASAATVALAVAGGADIVRVHDVREMARIARVADAVVRAKWRAADATAVTAVLALGSNLGDRVANLREALRRLREAGIAVTRASAVYETPPVPPGQPDYLNAAVAVETVLDPPGLLAAVKQIERDLGRRTGPRWGPRPIDLDILFYGDTTVDTPALSVPHIRIAERAFVLVPLADLFGDAPLPVLGRSAPDLLAALPREEIRPLGRLLDAPPDGKDAN